jgi:putative FmdB family regulatory protein
MPLYEYQCDSCGRRFELIRKFSDPPLEVCPTCGGPVHKLVSSPAFQFKGSGWYITDYAKKDQPAQSKSEESKSKTTSQDKEKESKATDKSDKAESAPPAPASPASPSSTTKTS